MEITHSLELELKVVVEDIVWGNNGIGHYEYGSEQAFDRGTDFIEDYHITEIYFVLGKTEIEIKNELFKQIEKNLQEDDWFNEQLEEKVKSEMEVMR